MRTRHKVPAIFSLSMVDMLCCALGCIILIWLLNAKQAKVAAAKSKQEIETLKSLAQSDREASRRLLAEAQAQHSRASERVRVITQERDAAKVEISDLNKKLDALQAFLAEIRKQLDNEQGRSKKLQEQLRQATDRVTRLETDLSTERGRLDETKTRLTNLAKSVSERDDSLKTVRADLTKREATIKGLQAELAAALEKQQAERERADMLAKSLAALERQRDKVDGELKESRSAKDKAEATLAQRVKELETALLKLAAAEKLVGERKAALEVADAKLARLEQEKRTLVAAAETRFAGIELTGKRVIFIVDTSGSMDMIDETTTAPEKWSEVCETVAKLIRSLPKLEKFQIIAFGPKFEYPLQSPGQWIEVDPKTSSDDALRAMKAIKPRGGTNMYVAFEEAFRFRADGLDTIYLLSDGLPNQGEGLTPTQRATVKGIERGLLLGKYIRTKLKTTWNPPINGQRVKIHTIGFFYESPDLGSFLWALARENDGSFVGMSKP